MDRRGLSEVLREWCIAAALREQGLSDVARKLREIEPDLSRQYTASEGTLSRYRELKIRAMHAFQCGLMLEGVERRRQARLAVVDIGDSAGTHMLYLKELTKGRSRIETVSVNLDPLAVEKIRARGLQAMLCRAEDLALDGPVDLFTCFETLEHLHNPALFLRRLARREDSSHLLLTVPYQRTSRVGLSHVRSGSEKAIHAEEEHIFELSPEDWSLLAWHAGWKVIRSRIYRQYPRKWPLLSWFLSAWWRRTDFEGFWGALLEKDRTFSDRYLDWEA